MIPQFKKYLLICLESEFCILLDRLLAESRFLAVQNKCQCVS